MPARAMRKPTSHPSTNGASESVAVEVQALRTNILTLKIVGDTELIVHNWSEKAKKMMLDKQMKVAVSKKEAKNPKADYESSFYKLPDGAYGFPAPGFKAACVGGCRFFEGLPMTVAKTALRVRGIPGNDGVELVPIEGAPRMREDMVRLETGVADIRYRGGFPHWRATLRISYVENVLSKEQVVNLVNAGGQMGVGEWRPSAPKVHSGSFGCFHVATDAEWDEYGALLVPAERAPQS